MRVWGETHVQARVEAAQAKAAALEQQLKSLQVVVGGGGRDEVEHELRLAEGMA